MNTNNPFGGFNQISQVIAETASDAIITINENSVILFVNQATEKIFGYSPDELIGQSLTMLMPEYLRHIHSAGLARYVTTGERHIHWAAVQLPGLRKDGSEVPLEVSFGEFIEGGERFFAGIARDITERKHTQEALKQSEQHLRSLIENATDIVTVLNREGNRVYVSPSVERSLGYRPEELIGRNPFELVHPDDIAPLKKLFAAGLAQPGFIVTKEYRIRRKDGSWRIHEATAHNLLDDPVVAGVVINSRDVTSRKRLERRLTVQYEAARILADADSLGAAAPQLLQAICESLGWDLGQLWIADREADKLAWIASWHDPSVQAGEFEDASRSRLFSPGVGLPGRVWASAAPHWIDDVVDDENFPRGAFALRAKLRSAFGFPIKLGDEVSGVMEFFTRERLTSDPTLLEVMMAIGNQIGQFIERKRVEDERANLYEREQRARLELEATMNRMRQVQVVTEVALSHLSLDKLLAELIDRVRDAMDVDTVVILLLEEDNHLVAWAAKGLELDLRIRVPMGKGFAGRVAEQKAPMVIDDIDKAMFYTPFLRDRGVKTLLGVPLLIEGRVLGVLHVGRLTPRPFTEDDTRLLQLVAFRVALAIDNARLFEEERSARREAEAASRAKDEFLTTISHELRTPLTPIIGWIHMMRNGLLPAAESAHGLEVIDKNSQSLKRLINDLLDMSAILSGKMRMEEAPVLLDGAVSEAVDMVRTFAAARNIKLELRSEDCRYESVIGDRTRLIQAFVNLLDNAIKFSSPGGVVKVACESNGDDAIVRVEDGGQGIASEFLPFVFDRFRQEDGSKTRSHGGLGLGLALVKSFVEAHKGTIQVESAGQGQGSRFTVRLPWHKAAAASGNESPQVQPTTSAPAHLMIIEDDPDTLEMLSATLKAHGFRVTAFDSASEMLERAPQNSVDLIISDIGMPELDGFEMIRQLRALPSYESVPAIALSGYASQKDVKAALAAGFNAHVSKPVDPSELTAMVNKLLKKATQAKRETPAKV
jgi:PAS domain S-box-containing protein